MSEQAQTSAIDVTPKQDGGVLKCILVPGTGKTAFGSHRSIVSRRRRATEKTRNVWLSVIVRFILISSGDETPGIGDTAILHYVGRLVNGDEFDSSIERKEPFSFTLGKGEVIEGWDMTVSTMKRGEKCQVTISPEYAYGQHGSPPKIKPNETLVFDIELIDWHLQDVSPDQSQSVLIQTLKQSDEFDGPRSGNVWVNLTGRVDSADGAVFDRRENLTIRLGEASEQFVPRGIEYALPKIRKGEICRVFIKSAKHAYDSNYPAPADTTIPDTFEQLVFDIEMLNFENDKDVWEMNNQERLEQAEITKEKGTTYFKQGKYELALRQYQKIIQFVGPPNNEEFGELSDERDKHLLSGYLNLAICHLKLDNPEEVVKNANLALKIDPNNPKAFFRRGLAFYATKDYEQAIQEFNECLEIEPGNKAAKNQIVLCKHQLKQHTEMEKKIYRNLFEVLSKDDQWFIILYIQKSSSKLVLFQFHQIALEMIFRKNRFQGVRL